MRILNALILKGYLGVWGGARMRQGFCVKKTDTSPGRRPVQTLAMRLLATDRRVAKTSRKPL